MATPKKKRIVVGSLNKPKPEQIEAGMPNYISIKEDVTLKKGEFLRAESKKFQLANLADAMKKGKISEEVGTSMRDRIEKIPEWVIADIVLLRDA